MRVASYRPGAVPALWMAVSIALGVGAAAVLPGADRVLLASFTLAVALVGAARWWGRRRLVTLVPLGALGAVVLGLAAAGALRYADTQQRLPSAHLAHVLAAWPDAEVHLEGVVAGEVEVRPGGWRFLVDATHLGLPDGTSQRVTGRVLASVFPADSTQRRPALAAGQPVGLAGRLRPSPARRNPADFDYGAYLRRRGVFATLTTYDAGAVVATGRPPPGISRLLYTARARVRAHLARFVPAPEAQALLQALLLGDRRQIDPEVRSRFVATGLMHLLAVSGLHVLLVGMVLYNLLRPLLLRLGLRWSAMERARTAVTLVLLVAYALLTGLPASVVRAVVMAAFFMGGALAQRPLSGLNLLGLAALVLLLASPAYLFDVGFQLSFSAVGALIVLGPVARQQWPGAWEAVPVLRWLAGSVTASLLATLGTLPILLYHFGFASFAGLVLNLPAIPLTLLVLAAGLLTVLFAGWVPALATLTGASASLLGEALLALATGGADLLGWAAWRGFVTSPWLLCGFALLLMAVAATRWRGRLAVLSLACPVVGLWLGLAQGVARPHLDVLFFDVGQGDATLIRLPGGRHLLVDAGVRDRYTDQGLRTILPHLARYGIRRLDAVVVTHPHSDHLGGLPALLRAIPVGRVLVSGHPYDSGLVAETRQLLDSLGLRAEPVAAGDTLALDPAVRLHVLWPRNPSALDPNDASVVLRVAYGQTAFLLTGDVEAAAEARLAAYPAALLQADVVKVAHHGSSTSSTAGFLGPLSQEGAPALAVVSVARSNRYGLPDEEVLARWQALGTTLWSTADAGALWLRSDGRRVAPVRWR